MPYGLREFIITLKDFNDLESFYEDMENVSTVDNIPKRAIKIAHRRPMSRNTHYMLYEGEVDLIKRDHRVLSIELSPEERNIKIESAWSQTSSLWNKSFTLSAEHRNWGLLRCFEQNQRADWGSDSVTNVFGTIDTTANGKNVDIVIVDGCIDPNHPEFAVNSDGSGGSRVIQFNWLQLRPLVEGLPLQNYIYTPYVDPLYPDFNGDGISDRTADNDHGCHVAGTAAGNTFGWAREANIYNINVYPSAPTAINFLNINDYIRAWHNTKPVNPKTGLRNPTITNHSYGSFTQVPLNSIDQVRFRGTIYNPPFTAEQLLSFGLSVLTDEVGTFQVRWSPASSALNADIEDAIKDGIIYVAAADNNNVPHDTFSLDPTRDYNNYITAYGSYTDFYSRGLWNNQKVIVVGSTNLESVERKATFSNTGRRVDVYAPGVAIISSQNSTATITVGDSRNSVYRISKKSGTSMASPQVAGVVATIAEQWQTIRNETARDFIIQTAKTGQLTTSSGGINDPYDLIFGENRYLTYKNLRRSEGLIGPKTNFGLRKTNGQLWPRTNILRYGS